MIKPHFSFTLWTPDEVAECLEGVPTEIYQALWDIVPHYRCKLTNAEREEPTPGTDCLADHWDRLTPEHQAKLNELAEIADRRGR